MATRQSTALAKWRRAAVRRLVASRRETLAVLARLPEAEILKARTQDRWSVKDVLGHLLACDEETVRRFALIARGHGDRIHWFESLAYADRFNARTVARLHRLGLRALLRQVQLVSDIVNPSWLALDRRQRFLYAAHGDGADATAFAVDQESGRLTLLNRQPTSGRNGVRLAIDASNRFVVLANYSTGTVAVL